MRVVVLGSGVIGVQLATLDYKVEIIVVAAL